MDATSAAPSGPVGYDRGDATTVTVCCPTPDCDARLFEAWPTTKPDGPTWDGLVYAKMLPPSSPAEASKVRCNHCRETHAVDDRALHAQLDAQLIKDVKNPRVVLGETPRTAGR